MADDKVIIIDFRSPPVVVTPSKLTRCQHKRVEVDETDRTVCCLACGQALDPVQVLIDQAKAHCRVQWRIEELRELEAREAERRDAKVRRATDTAKKRMRYISRPEEAVEGEYVLAARVKCSQTGAEKTFLIASPQPGWRGGANQAVLELLAPRLFFVFGWTLVREAVTHGRDDG